MSEILYREYQFRYVNVIKKSGRSDSRIVHSKNRMRSCSYFGLEKKNHIHSTAIYEVLFGELQEKWLVRNRDKLHVGELCFELKLCFFLCFLALITQNRSLSFEQGKQITSPCEYFPSLKTGKNVTPTLKINRVVAKQLDTRTLQSQNSQGWGVRTLISREARYLG